MLVDDRWVVTPFCLEHASFPGAHLAPIRCAIGAALPMPAEGRRAIECRDLHVINGMGVTLGDSVIGLQALHVLKTRNRGMRIHVYRSPYTPELNRLYRRVPFLETVADLPVPLEAFAGGAVVDLADFVFRPAFARTPMIDYFLAALGVDPRRVGPWEKNPDWLRELRLPSLPPRPGYVMFCPRASTPLRSIPPPARRALVDAVCRHWPGDVLGFGRVDHPRYRELSGSSSSLGTYLAWLRGAAAVVTTDTSSLHIAAGFRLPTLAYFVSIAPPLRSGYYPTVSPVDLVHEELRGLHSSNDPGHLTLRDRVWDSYVAGGGAAGDIASWIESIG